MKIKKVIGKFKDETAGQPITEFVGLKSKMYSYTTESKNKTAKGVKKNNIKRDLGHLDYLECLLNNSMMRHEMKGIKSEDHKVSTYKSNKISLSCYDDKRYILDDESTSYAYGHYKIN